MPMMFIPQSLKGRKHLMNIGFVALAAATGSCKTTTVYVSRHAEKAGTSVTNDPPLTAKGEAQAQRLAAYLQRKNITGVYSTNTTRTRSTAAPAAASANKSVVLYAQIPALVDSLKSTPGGNVLIVGHSNTVDDIVNRFTGTGAMRDLPDSAYGDVFIVKKKGRGYRVDSLRLR